ncbi:hypothetical protein Glove_40g180 [Diversispora epigaea]|uniref:Uncharacterized protein n=1 Tax=Diversispora epigaea TaxID=1348612 RepID=A0A397JK29_9GLOM|nr:hypothetical protein Glove_40g180 [Diversispora epigaea]
MAPETLEVNTLKNLVYILLPEVFTSYPPYYNVPHDANLVMDICKGLKPEIKCEIPQLLKDLMGNLILFIYHIYMSRLNCGTTTPSHLETLVCDEWGHHKLVLQI